MKNRQLIIVVTSLIVVAVFLFVYKITVLDFPLAPSSSESWRVEAKVDVESTEENTIAQLFLPQSEGNFGVVEEKFFSEDFGLTLAANKQGNRLVTWSANNLPDSRFNLYYQADVYRFQRAESPVGTARDPSQFLEYKSFIEDWSDSEKAALNRLQEKIAKRSATTETYIQQAVSTLTDEEISEEEDILLSDPDRPLPASVRANGIALLSRMNEIPARAVRGLDLRTTGRRVRTVHWVEIWQDGAWQSYDIETGKLGIPNAYFPWWRGFLKAAKVDGGKLRGVTFSVRRITNPQYLTSKAIAEIKKDPLYNLTLFELPVDIQQVYRIMLMVPIGVLVLIILRQFVGLRTFGTFTPVLVALAFRETNLIAGIILFTVLVTVGLLFRSYFEKLKLLSVPRLASVLLIVILLMMVSSTIVEMVQIGSGVYVALLPMVILAMVIERMSVVWEEYGARESIKRGLASLLAAILAYLVMSISYIQFLIFAYPELLLIVLAITILMGRYTGYRLLELYRFSSLVKQE
ncbi:MAG: UUP1 family membrane protein [Spirulina sp.]